MFNEHLKFKVFWNIFCEHPCQFQCTCISLSKFFRTYTHNLRLPLSLYPMSSTNPQTLSIPIISISTTSWNFTFSPTYSHLGSYFINLPYMTFSIKQVGSHCIFIKYCLKKQQKQKQKQTNKHIFREWKYTENLPINTYQTEGTYYNFEWYPEKACSFLLFWLWYFCPRTCFLPIELSSFRISQY